MLVEQSDALRRKLARGSNPYWEVPGGFICHNITGNSLDAHCGSPDHMNKKTPCRLNRTRNIPLKGWGGRGRPIGFLLAWLEYHQEWPTRQAHSEATMPRTQTPTDVNVRLSHARRLACRLALAATGRYADLFALERAPFEGEGEEPPGLP